ncbi:MAG: hypothetical protein ACQXXL_08485, partial [Candidatus Methanosuratincola sp.]
MTKRYAVERGTVEKRHTSFRRIWKQFRRNRPALIGLMAIFLNTTLAIFAPLIAPYDPIKIDLRASRQPP